MVKMVSCWVCLLVGLWGCVGVDSANPNYSYHVRIDDGANGNFQEKAETRKGPDAVGFYSVVEPNGALRRVEYTADDRGFNPVVTYSPAAPQGHHAPSLTLDRRAQIVDKLQGPPPQLPPPFQLPPATNNPLLLVPAPLRENPTPKLIAGAIGVNYAPAYMPPITAFLHQPQVLIQPQPQLFVQPQVVLQPQEVKTLAPVQEVRGYLPPPVEQVRTYLPPPPPPPPVEQQVRTYLPPPAPQPQIQLALPKVAVVEDSYASPPKNTVTDPSAPTYPDAKPPTNTYGPPGYTPGKPLEQGGGVKVHVTVAEIPPEVVTKPKKVVVEQYAPQYVQQPPLLIPPPPPPLIQKYVQPAPLPQQDVNLYAGALGYHTHTSAPSSYLHSYGTQGFQVTSSRQYNHGVLLSPTVPLLQKYQPQPALIQPPYYSNQQHSYAPQYAIPNAPLAPLPPPVQAPLLVGKKQNPLTFAYSYDQGTAKVSHSYSGSGW